MLFWPVIFFPSFFPVDERTALLVKKPPAPGMPLGLVYKEVVAEYKTESTQSWLLSWFFWPIVLFHNVFPVDKHRILVPVKGDRSGVLSGVVVPCVAG